MADGARPETVLRIWADAYTWLARRDLAGRFKRVVGERAVVTIHAHDEDGAGLAIDLTGGTMDELRRVAEEARGKLSDVPGYQLWID
jgi:hypothetical protein